MKNVNITSDVYSIMTLLITFWKVAKTIEKWVLAQLCADIKYDSDEKHNYSFVESAVWMNYEIRRELRREVRYEVARLELWGALHDTYMQYVIIFNR